ncbi:TetR/AcrR family transcriptional regulator [Specibacter cremeus]|uniref:TetR/AcrR family transcriptional regulator n=1 Tax=Specibacter cremeus TaxID=1629051 RepID=UPI000F7AEA13|nr:TetR family transcriptional regulator [Specibacter cremeus]
MSESAKNAVPDTHPGLRERKREATRSAITATARLFTANRGLNGFTVEQVCEEVGISRRTFFNYFPSKEDAIIGYLLDDFPPAAMAAFLAGGARRSPSGVSASLLHDLVELACAVADQVQLTRENAGDLMAAMRVEPQLMLKMMGSVDAREKEFAGLIAQREGLPSDDPLAQLAAALFGALSRRAGAAFFTESNTRTYRELLTGHLAQAQGVFIHSLPPSEGTR